MSTSTQNCLRLRSVCVLLRLLIRFSSSISTLRGTSVLRAAEPCLPESVDTSVASRSGVAVALRCANAFHSDFGVALRLPWWPTL